MKIKSLLLIATAGIAMASSCKTKTSTGSTDSTAMTTDSTKNDTSGSIKPSGPAPGWAPDIKPEMQAVIEKLASYGDKPIESLTPAQARMNHTPADAVNDLMKEHHIAMPVFNVDTVGKDIAVKGGTIHIRIYTPKSGNGPFPIVVYYHGGGFVIAGIDAYDATPNVLSDKTNAIVISVGYRLAPENKFPTALMDSYDAYKWAIANASSIKGDPKNIAVAGESAGGNIAVNMAIMARDKGAQAPKHILAVYPVAGTDTATASYVKNANAKPLDKAMMIWFVKYYTNGKADMMDPRINLLAANLKGLPPTTIITDELDPLQSEGMALAEKMKAAGVTVDSKNYDGVTHEFFGMGAIVPQAKEAEMYAVDQLTKCFKMK